MKEKVKLWILKKFFASEVREIVSEAVCDAIHPEFGFVWNSDEYKEYLLQTCTNAMLQNVVVKLREL